MDATSWELVCTSVGVVVVSALFVVLFLDKYHTRHIGPGPQKARHRHPKNVRQTRRGEIKEFDTMDLSKIRREVREYNYLRKVDPAETISIEGS